MQPLLLGRESSKMVLALVMAVVFWPGLPARTVGAADVYVPAGSRFDRNEPAAQSVSRPAGLALAVASTGSAAVAATSQPVLGTPPSSKWVPEGLGTTFTVVAAGTALSYQWRKDGLDIRGATNDTIRLEVVRPENAGSYSVVIRNRAGSVTSAPPAILTVKASRASVSGSVVAWGYNDHGQTAVPADARTGVIAIAAGISYSAAVKDDGRVLVWGKNSSEQAGQTNVPSGLTGVMSVAGGYGHTLALKRDGTVVAWGNNDSGQSRVPPRLSDVIAVAAGVAHSVALRKDGTVVAWGDCSVSEAPCGPFEYPVQVFVRGEYLKGVTAIAAGRHHTVALKDDGTVIAWGMGTEPIPGTGVSRGQSRVPAGLKRVTAIAAGPFHSVAVKDDGGVIAWGYNYNGQTNVPPGAQRGVTTVSAGAERTVAVREDGSVLVWGIKDPVQTPVPEEALSGVVDVAAGQDHTLALVVSPAPPTITMLPASQTVGVGQNLSLTVDAPGALFYQWRMDGRDIEGATGAAYNLGAAQPYHAGDYTVMVGNTAGSITSAPPAALVVNAGTSGSVTTWGDNVRGYLTVPSAARRRVTAIAKGSAHTLALTKDGTVVAWGNNAYGQVTGTASRTGNPSVDAASFVAAPVTLHGQVLHGVTAIAAGSSHSVALRNNGAVVAWGAGTNLVDERGNSSPGQSLVPAAARNGVAAIAAVDQQTVALKTDGSLVVWGDAGKNVPVAARSRVVAIAAGGSHFVALRMDGTLVAWGSNGYGESTVPEAARTGVRAIAAGGSRTMVLKTDGTVVAWGWNNYGQVTGTATVGNSNPQAPGFANPVTLGGQVLQDVVALAASAFHSVALASNGTVVAWGAGTNDTSRSPNPVFPHYGQSIVPARLGGVVAIAAGTAATVALVGMSAPQERQIPAVAIGNSLNGSVLAEPASVAIRASAGDIDGTIAKVELFAGERKLGEALLPPYEFFWENVPPGDHTLTVRVTDNEGLSSLSAPVSFTVLEKLEPPLPIVEPTPITATWTSLVPSIPGTDSSVFATATDASGHLYLGGSFTVAGDVVGNRVAGWDGTRWSALGSGMNGTVRALAVLDGGLYAGGEFTTAGGTGVNYIARWDGTRWFPLGSGTGGYVHALAVSGRDLYVGGEFQFAGGVGARRIAKWNGATWSPLGSGVGPDYGYGPVLALAVFGTDVYVGGQFVGTVGVSSRGILKWNGNSWSGLGSGLGQGFSSVVSLSVSENGVYAAGDFTPEEAGGAQGVARWDGERWSTLGPLPEALLPNSYRGNAILASKDDVIVARQYSVITETFGSYIFSTPTNDLVRWDGVRWSSLGTRPSGPVHVLSEYRGEWCAGGGFAAIGDSGAKGLARWSGGAWSAFGAGLAINGAPYALAVSGKALYVGGQFRTADGKVNAIAQWDGNGWSTLGAGMNDTVLALAAIGNDLYAGGRFTSVNGKAASLVAKWDGRTWSPMAGLSGDLVTKLCVSGDDVYAAGEFGTSLDRYQIAKWNGQAWTPLAAWPNSHSVTALAASGSNVFAARDYTLGPGGTGMMTNDVVRWDGASWSVIGSGGASAQFPSLPVTSLAVSEGQVYACGAFTKLGGVEANHIAQWDGRRWSALGWSTNRYVAALAVSDGVLYVGGSSNLLGIENIRVSTSGYLEGTSIRGSPGYIAKWDGSGWSVANTRMNGPVSTLVAAGDEVYAGGAFTTVDDSVSAHVAQVSFRSPIALSLALEGSQLTLSWPSSPAGFRLQETPSCANPGSWEYSHYPYTTNGGVVRAVALVPTDRRFFRLRREP